MTPSSETPCVTSPATRGAPTPGPRPATDSCAPMASVIRTRRASSLARGSRSFGVAGRTECLTSQAVMGAFSALPKGGLDIGLLIARRPRIKRSPPAQPARAFAPTRAPESSGPKSTPLAQLRTACQGLTPGRTSAAPLAGLARRTGPPSAPPVTPPATRPPGHHGLGPRTGAHGNVAAPASTGAGPRPPHGHPAGCGPPCTYSPRPGPT